VAEETAALTGGDFERNLPQMRKERRMLKEAGLAPEPSAPKAPANGSGMPAKPTDAPQNEDQPEES
jgi:hypothetical protein